MSHTLVILESPYAPSFKKPQGECECARWNHAMCDYHEQLERWEAELERNLRYARACMKDSLLRGEAPFVSHLLYTQKGVLDDTIPEQRKHGIEAGWAWRDAAQKTVCYTDLGISPGMEGGLLDATNKGRPIEMRSLPDWDKK